MFIRSLFKRWTVDLTEMLSFFFNSRSEDLSLLKNLVAIEEKKLKWQDLFFRVKDLSKLSRIYLKKSSRSILHLAVIDNQLDVIQQFKNDIHLKGKRDLWGLSPIELAKFLDRKEALRILQSEPPRPAQPEMPNIDGFEYLSQPVFETKEGLDQVLSSLYEAKQNDMIPSEKIWMGIYYEKELLKAKEPKISIRHVDSEIGYGVYSERKIEPCAYVGEYVGIIQQRKEKQLKKKKYCVALTVWGGKKHFCIDAEIKGNFTRFLNHSKNPNLMLQSVYSSGLPRMIFIALRAIEAGEELTFDYGDLYWK